MMGKKDEGIDYQNYMSIKRNYAAASVHGSAMSTTTQSPSCSGTGIEQAFTNQINILKTRESTNNTSIHQGLHVM